MLTEEESMFFNQAAQKKQIVEIVKKQQLNLIDLPPSMIQCRRCLKYTVDYSQKQTRKSDEAPTDFYKCRSCGERWKQNS